MRVAVIHYWFITRRGGEKVVEKILEQFPDADVYTLFYDKERYGDYLKNHKVFTSILNQPHLIKHYQKIFPLYPIGIRSLKLKEKYDLIISSESGPAKGIEKPKDTPHVCYIHSPMRYCWGFTHEYLNSVNKYMKPILACFFERLRVWDKTTINNVDLYIANSYNVANRVEKFYNRNSIVIYPPIKNDFFVKNTFSTLEKDIYLSFGAVTPYKRIDLLVDAFNKNGKKLVIIGDGSERGILEKKANSNIQFLGNLEWREIESYFAITKALIFPGEEDFGMIPLEVMAYGIPVLAYKKGGALETIVENLHNIRESSGMFFEKQEVNCINETISKFELNEKLFDKHWIKNHAANFKEDIFVAKFIETVSNFLSTRNFN